MGKNVAVFVDVANIFYAAKAAGVDIDYVTLLKSAVSGRDFVRAYAYTGLDPENENQRNFHSFLSRHGYRVVSKDIRKYGDGKVKANLDIELVVDLMKTARNLDVAIVVSGDGDFAPAIRAVQEMGVRVEVISFRGNTSSDLIDVADIFTDITQIARVEKGSSRSGRRVAGDEMDLSMTEVPDKQTEGSGRGRGRTGRGRGRAGEAEPVAAADGRARRGRGRVAAGETDAAGAPLTVLPGERLSRARPVGAVSDVGADAGSEEAEDEERVVETGGAIGEDGEGRRRRRRRGGRGRGRGRGRPDEAVAVGDAGGEAGDAGELDRDVVDEEERAPARRAPRAAAFGSVWDAQIGVPREPTRTPTDLGPLPADEEFDDEPAIPEYLIAERHGLSRGRSAGAQRGGRGARSGYSAAVDRERFGRGGGGGGGGINRYPDVSRRGAPRGGRDAGRRDDRYGRGGDRPPRQERGPGAGPRPGEQWSEVPPELEAMLRAQLAAKSSGGAPSDERPRSRPVRAAGGGGGRAADAGDAGAGAAGEAEAAAVAPRRGRPRASVAPAGVTAGKTAAPTPDAKPATRRRTTRTTGGDAGSSAPAAGTGTEGPVESSADAPKRRGRPPGTARAARGTSTGSSSETADAGTPRRSGRTRTASADASGDGPGGAASPRRRTTRASTAAPDA